ncbi:MAG: hypothetical protein HOH14_04065 [Gammaproteobacteria bacterium]|nr:hypothetical protein [Gammaproteobacteria bacterium]MBT6042652.1 hypothetical protein [Gammaproteobacteria bacterium]
MITLKQTLSTLLSMFLAAGICQQTFAQQDGEIPRTASGKPDFNGLWEFAYVPDMAATNGRNQFGPGELPFTEAGQRNFDNYNPTTGDYTGACLPFGHVRSMNSPNPVKFFQTDSDFAYLFEVNNWHKSFPIDGNPDPFALPATWYGNANATWDGDTLVVTSGNYNGKTRLDTVGHPHSHKITVTERFTLRDALSLDYEITIDDPIYYSEPWSNRRIFTRMTDGFGLLEYSCNENNKGLWEGRILVPDYDNWHTYDIEE